MIKKLITESVGLTFGNFCNEDLIAREWWRMEALISFSQFVLLCNYFNLNWFRFKFLPNTNKKNNIICWNSPAPLVLLSEYKESTIKINILKNTYEHFCIEKEESFREGGFILLIKIWLK